MNWKGRPLESFRTIVELIAATKACNGLKVRAEHDTGYYPTGVKVTNAELAAVPITRHNLRGDGNYTIHPDAPGDTQPDELRAGNS